MVLSGTTPITKNSGSKGTQLNNSQSTRGRTPMEKNTIVLDELGQIVGETYSKRASGLVKKGRAEYVDDHTIRFVAHHAPTILLDVLNDMEELKVSKVIDFNAREFRFDETNQGQNVGSRMFITDMFDKATEVFEIGSLSAWTQICSDKVLEKDTDYIFRFGLLRGVGFGNTTSQFILIPDDNWDDRFVFSLTNDEFKPAAIKKWNGSDFRIYEIPFNTGSVEKYRFVIVQHAAVAKVFPAKEVMEYSFLENSNCENSRFSKMKPNFEFDFDTEAMKKDFSDFGKAAESTVKSAFGKISNAFATGFNNVGNAENKAKGTAADIKATAADVAEEPKATVDNLVKDVVEEVKTATETVVENATSTVREEFFVASEVVETADEQ